MVECLLWVKEFLGSNPTVPLFIDLFFKFYYFTWIAKRRRAGLSPIAEFLVLDILLIFLEIGPSQIIFVLFSYIMA